MMLIQRIYIAGHRDDLRWTQCCVASIRRWYPDIPISLIKDLHRGPYDTADLESYWDVGIMPTDDRVFGWGMSKLEPLLLPSAERILVMDSDVLFVGRVLDRLADYDEDFVADGHWQPERNIDAYFFDRQKLKSFDPDFVFPGYVFNSGIVAATAGLLSRTDFAGLVEFGSPPRLLRRDVFADSDQGVLNYVVLRKAQNGQLTLARPEFQVWAGHASPWRYRLQALSQDSPHPEVLHFAGPKKTLFSANCNGHLARHFEAAYYARLPHGRRRRLRDRLHRLVAVLTGRQPWTRYV